MHEHTSPLFKDLNVIKLFDEVTVHIAVFMYKFKNQLLPTNFNVFFTSIKPIIIITTQGFPLEWLMLCPKQEQTMELKDIKVLRSGMLSVITLSFYHLNNLRKS